MAKRPRSEAQRAASRANGRRSRGPKTAEGKSRSRRNALRHGLRATRLEGLPDLDSHPAVLLIEAVRQRLAPRDVLEVECAEGIALAFWRLRRVRYLEDAILGGGDPRPGESALAEAFARRTNGAGAVALLLRYRNQALSELNRWFRLLETGRTGTLISGQPVEAATSPAAALDAAANDNRAAEPPVPRPLS